ncbi:MAG: copper amine oxidase N-terminal domain-containing protein [Fimbriimonas sp.]
MFLNPIVTAALSLGATLGAAQGDVKPIEDIAPADGEIKINVNGQRVFTHLAPPQMIDGRVLVPIRGVLEKLGVKVEWHAQERAVVAIKDDRAITLGIGAKYGTVGEKFVPLDVPARIVNGRTMVPLRYVAEAADAYVMWDAERTTVVITTRWDGDATGT